MGAGERERFIRSFQRGLISVFNYFKTVKVSKWSWIWLIILNIKLFWTNSFKEVERPRVSDAVIQNVQLHHSLLATSSSCKTNSLISIYRGCLKHTKLHHLDFISHLVIIKMLISEFWQKQKFHWCLQHIWFSQCKYWFFSWMTLKFLFCCEERHLNGQNSLLSSVCVWFPKIKSKINLTLIFNPLKLKSLNALTFSFYPHADCNNYRCVSYQTHQNEAV